MSKLHITLIFFHYLQGCSFPCRYSVRHSRRTLFSCLPVRARTDKMGTAVRLMEKMVKTACPVQAV
ncbi:hypothetical protein FHW08_002257 [Pantoea agglomerans]|nr:hypothetical protein [Pantoea agglomerans]MBA8874143.1 hypothetical protein [Pantoea agglomerans]